MSYSSKLRLLQFGFKRNTPKKKLLTVAQLQLFFLGKVPAILPAVPQFIWRSGRSPPVKNHSLWLCQHSYGKTLLFYGKFQYKWPCSINMQLFWHNQVSRIIFSAHPTFISPGVLFNRHLNGLTIQGRNCWCGESRTVWSPPVPSGCVKIAIENGHLYRILP